MNKVHAPSQQTYYDFATSRHGRGLLSLYKQGELCDVEFLVHGERVMAHKIILCSASNFFRVMFESKFRESESNLVDLSATFSEVSHLRDVIDYIYKGEIFLTLNSVFEVLDVSVQFLLEDLKVYCAQFLLEMLRPQTSLSTLYVARLYDLRELEEISQTVTYSTFCRKLIFNKNVASLSAMFLASMLHDSSLNINAIDRVELVLHWLSFDLESRQQDAEELIKNFLRQNPLPINSCPKICDTFSGYNSEFQNLLKSQLLELLQDQRCHLEANPHSLSPASHNSELSWCILLQEEDCDSVAFYCTRNRTWFSCPLNCEDLAIIGFVSPNQLAVKMHKTLVSLVDLTTGARKSVANITRMLPRRNTIAENTLDFFCDDGSLYAIITVFSEPIRRPYFKVYHFESTTETWAFCMDVHYEYFGDDMAAGDRASVSLKVCTGQFSVHYLMVTVSTKRRIETTSAKTGVHEYRFQEMKNFHVIKVDPRLKTYQSCGVRWHDPVSLDQLPALILSDRICFLKLDRKLLAEKLRMSFLDQEECYMDALCLDLSGQIWEKVTIGIPPPNVTPLPMTIDNETFYKLDVSHLFNRLFVGIHTAPHVYQMAVYDLENFSATLLPPTSLPSVNNISISTLALPQMTNAWMTDAAKYLDIESFCFSGFLLKNDVLT